MQELLDGTDIDIDEAMPIVQPNLSLNCFVNPILTQTLNDITRKKLGVLGTPRVSNADMVIHKLADQLHSAVESNDNSTASL